MTFNQYLERAIEGGYTNPFPWIENVLFMRHRGMGKKTEEEFLMRYVLMDVKSWEAVGKVEGWNKVYEDLYTEGYKRTEKDFAKEIRLQAGNKMHQMIDALIEGGSIESYLKTL